MQFPLVDHGCVILPGCPAIGHSSSCAAALCCLAAECRWDGCCCHAAPGAGHPLSLATTQHHLSELHRARHSMAQQGAAQHGTARRAMVE
jgi:hypothetical protein